MTRHARAAVLLACVATVGCASGPAVVPLRGPKPGRILVVPAVKAGSVEDLAALDLAIGRELIGRGYEVDCGHAALEKLTAVGWRTGDRPVGELGLSALRAQFGVDAVWTTDVRAWRFEPSAGLPFVFDMSVGLRATLDGAELWSHDLEGEQPTAERRTVLDPFADRDPFEADDPVPWRRASRVLEDDDIVALVARAVGRRLPER